jgi:signal peptidase I
MQFPTMASGTRRLPLASFLRAIAVAITLAALGLTLLVRGLPLTGRTTLVVAGPSMAPAIGVGSAIVLEPTDPARLAVGDIVSLRVGPTRAIFTHRIVRLIARDGAVWLETRGDANATPDPAIVPASDVIGRVVVAIPYAGYLVALASQPSGAILILAVGLLLLLAASLLDARGSAAASLQPA